MTTDAQVHATATLGRQLLNKVPEVTLYFWIIKVMATTVGETAAYILTRPLGASVGDYLSQPGDNGGLGLGTVGTRRGRPRRAVGGRDDVPRLPAAGVSWGQGPSGPGERRENGGGAAGAATRPGARMRAHPRRVFHGRFGPARFPEWIMRVGGRR
jgi:hypothetical protein